MVVKRPVSELSAAELMAHCKTLIAGYKCPRSVQFVEALPLSGAGKVLKTKLREPHWQGHCLSAGNLESDLPSSAFPRKNILLHPGPCQ